MTGSRNRIKLLILRRDKATIPEREKKDLTYSVDTENYGNDRK